MRMAPAMPALSSLKGPRYGRRIWLRREEKALKKPTKMEKGMKRR